MSSFVVSARKYRPIRFDDVVGQEHITGTLKNALRSDHLAHAFLFCGPRGVGKTTCARILGKVLNCMNPTPDFEPCDTCPSCKAFNESASFNIIELDAASNNSVEHIRSLIDQVRFQPQQGKYKVFIIDEVHMLSQAAFNAFLKTLEEPPSYAIFILATTEKHKILPTILSRCQIFDFKRIQVPQIAAHLEGICTHEGLEAEPEALHVIAQKADGALRDALSIFDRMVSSAAGKKIAYQDVIANLNVLDYDYYFRLADALVTEDLSQILLLFNEILNNGFETDLFLNGFAEHLRNLLMCKDPETLVLLELSSGIRDRYMVQAAQTPHFFLLSALNLVNDCDVNLRQARNKRLHVELYLIKMAHITRAMDIQAGQLLKPGAEEEKKKPEPEKVAPPTEVEPADPNQAALFDPPAAETAPQAAPPLEPTEKNSRPSWGSSKHLAATPRLDQLTVSTDESNGKAASAAKKADLELTSENLVKEWKTYLQGISQETVRNLLLNTEVRLEGETLTAQVTSALIENTLREERGLLEYLREKFGNSRLALAIQVVKPVGAPAQPAGKPLTNKEKLLKLYEKNPLVKEMAERFSLRFDGD
ncbi:MAG: Holliday junction ATP-dependent DNA helicase RuvB [Haliscomenobacter sp.]|nr:Holliday junction ATP-dependent DNA helicase RuvB [Haliscomenobacter sp.]